METFSTPQSSPSESCPSGEAPSAVATPAGLTADTLAALRARALGDLYFFCKGVLGLDKMDPEIHRPLCRLLELCAVALSKRPFPEAGLTTPWPQFAAVLRDTFRRRGIARERWPELLRRAYTRGISKLALLLPRGWFKTTLTSIAFPCWLGVRDPNVRCLLAQNTFTNAASKGRALGQTFDGGELLRALFPAVLPGKHSRWSDEGRCLARSAAWAESTYEFAGAGTQVTSRHYDLIIEDDTVAPAKDDLSADNVLPSKEAVDQAIGWHRLVQPLLVDLSSSVSIVVGTRWWELDLLRWVMDNEPSFLVYQRGCRENDAGVPDPQGHLTWAARFDTEVLQNLEHSLGPYLFSCLYYNLPMSSSDMLYRLEQFKYYDMHPQLHDLLTFTTVDLANDPADCKGPPDYNVVLTCGKHRSTGDIYVLNYFRARCGLTEVIDAIFKHVEMYHPLTVGIETQGYQKAMLPWVRQRQRDTRTYFHVTPLTHNVRSKSRRVQGLDPWISFGRLYLAPWMTVLTSELCMFTPRESLGTNDDVADALSMQAELWRVTAAEAEQKRVAPLDRGTFDYYLAEAERERPHDDVGPLGVPFAWGQAVSRRIYVSN